MVSVVDTVRDDVERVAREPRSAVRWVRMDGLHLTLRFLGPTDAARVASVAAAVRRAAQVLAPFHVTLGGGGAFPSPSRPRTLWIGVRDGQSQLAALAAGVEDEVAREGWPRSDRPFRAHLTLARSDGRREGPLVARRLIERAVDLRVEVAVDRLVLFESVTGSGAARYEPLATEPLSGASGEA